MNKENLEFGQGSFIGPVMRDQSFFELPTRERAKIIGWANSCPVTDELTDPDNPNPGRGPEAMLQRYAEVNFWFGFIKREAKRLNPEIYFSLDKLTPREDNEPAGKYEVDNVPKDHDQFISPMGTLAGYALPRIFVEQLGTHKGVTKEELQDRIIKGLDVLEDAIPKAKTPLHLLALVGEGLIEVGCSPGDVLKHSLSQGWVNEHNGHNAITEFRYMMMQEAPELWAAYNSLPEEERDKLA